ncbi:MAG: PAS domain S-box protein, partial [Rhodothermales bacterium]|nr:PAS domain S-box protein [Rhodothermales bacterium]
TPLSHSFCQYVVGRDAPLAVEDAREDPLVRENLAIRDLDVVAYLGVPLRTPGGHPIGSLCAIDSEPRAWSAEDREALETLAEMVMTEIAVRHHLRERILAEAVLRESEARLRAVAATASDFAYAAVLGPAGQFVREWVTGDYEGVTGYRPDETGPTEAWRHLVHPDDLGIAEGHFSRLGAGAPSAAEFRIRRKDGAVRWVRDAARPEPPTEEGRVNRVWGAITDVTDRKEMEVALRESESRFRDMADAAPALLWVTDPDGACTFLSRSWYEYTGQTEAEALGLGWVEAVHPDDRDAARDIFLRANAQREPFRLDYRLRRRDGVYRWAIDAGRPWFGADGAFRGFVGSVIDFHDRKEAEDALRESEAHLRRVIDNMHAFVAVLGVDGVILDVNEPALAVAGLSREDVVGQRFWEGYWWSHDAGVAARIEETVRRAAAGEVARFDVSARIAGDGRLLVDFMLVPVRDERGEILYLIPSGVDITERKQAEEALRERESRFRALFSSIDEGYCLCEMVLDADGRPVDYRFLEVNPLFEAMTGLADATGRTAYELVPGLEPHWVETYARVALGGESLRFEQGSEVMGRWFDVFATPVEPRGRFAVVFKDVTEQRRAEVELRQSEARFRATFETAAVGIAHVGTDGRWILVNDRLCDIVGYAREELLQKTFQDITHPDDLDADLALVQRLLAGEIERYQLEKRYIRKDGSPIWILLTVSLVRDEAGEPVHLVSVVEDISERKAAERALIELNETLEERIAARTAELQRSNAELDQFAYVASHDLKAPLRAIDNLAAWIAEDAAPLLPEDSKRHLDTLQGRVRRMERLLDDLLAYSRAGRDLGGPEEVDVGALVASVVELLDPPAGFRVEVEGRLPTLLTPPAPLETVFRNLIGNAIKHHDRPHEGRLRITAEEGGAAGEVPLVRFTVADDGPGIAPAYHDRIFRLFQTLKPRDTVEGSGIGLAIVKKAVESRGGTIAVGSVEGGGTTFTFTWPKRPPAA